MDMRKKTLLACDCLERVTKPKKAACQGLGLFWGFEVWHWKPSSLLTVDVGCFAVFYSFHWKYFTLIWIREFQYSFPPVALYNLDTLCRIITAAVSAQYFFTLFTFIKSTSAVSAYHSSGKICLTHSRLLLYLCPEQLYSVYAAACCGALWKRWLSVARLLKGGWAFCVLETS